MIDQSENEVKVELTSNFGSNGQLVPTLDWSNITTIPPTVNDENQTTTDSNVETLLSTTTLPTVKAESQTTTDSNVEALLNTKRAHPMKRNGGIRDSLPGIIGKYG